MPRLVLEGLKGAGIPSLALGIDGIISDDLQDIADECLTIPLLSPGKAIRACLKRGIQQIIFAGRVKHDNVLSIKPWKADWTALKILWSSRQNRQTMGILGSVANAFEDRGIQVISSVKFLQKYLAMKGSLTKRAPSAQETADIQYGWSIAKGIADLDVGQTILIKKSSVIAVEAMEGTDACIERAGEIAGSHCVMIKVARSHQDMRLDVPVIGKNTIQKLAKIKATALAIEAEKTLVLDPDVISEADALGIAIVALV